MRNTFIFILLMTAMAACKKSGPDYAATIMGKWQYTQSSLDTLQNNSWKTGTPFYDPTAVSIFAQELSFVSRDTVYYLYDGTSAWSNYQVNGNQLLLIGSTGSNALTIQQLDATKLKLQMLYNTNYHYNFYFEREQ